MSDVGSQFCGFMLALFGIAAARFEAAPLSFLLVPLLLSAVLYDVALTLFRRLIAGENLARAHNGHLYQIAGRAGMDARAIAALHWAFAMIGGLAAIGFLAAPAPWKLPVALLPLLFQFAWTGYVWRLARAARLANL